MVVSIEALAAAFPWQIIGNQNFRMWQIDRVKFHDCHRAFVALGTHVLVVNM